MMKTGQHIQLYPAMIRKQWRVFALLIGSTSLVLAALSVGLALPTWRLLFQALRQFPLLQAQQGTKADSLLLLLFVQAGFSLAAWVLLIWITVRAFMRLRAMGSQLSDQLANQPALSPVANNQPLAAPHIGVAHQPAMQPTVMPAASTASRQAITPALVPSTVVQQPPALAFSSAATVLPERPILPRVRVTLMPEQPALPEPKAQEQLAASTQHTPVPTVRAPEIVSGSSQPQKSTQIGRPGPVPSGEASVLRQTPLSSPGPVVRAQEQPSAPSLRQRAPGKQPEEREQKDPFAVNEDAVQMFLQGDALPVPKTQAGPKPASTSMPGAEFVFGNPFEGLLPDVFEHDEDLKRSIKEQQLHLHPKSLSDQ